MFLTVSFGILRNAHDWYGGLYNSLQFMISVFISGGKDHSKVPIYVMLKIPCQGIMYHAQSDILWQGQVNMS